MQELAYKTEGSCEEKGFLKVIHMMFEDLENSIFFLNKFLRYSHGYCIIMEKMGWGYEGIDC